MNISIKLISRNDAELAKDIYRKIVSTGHSSFLLCVKDETEDGFVETMTSKEHVLFSIQVNGESRGIIWLNGFNKEGAGNTHFCIFGNPPGTTKIFMFRKALSLIIGLKDKQGFVFDMLLGLLPESHAPALEFAKRCGLTVHYDLPFDVPYPATSPFTGDTEKSIPVTVTRDMFMDIQDYQAKGKNKKALKKIKMKRIGLAMKTREAITRARSVANKQEVA